MELAITCFLSVAWMNIWRSKMDGKSKRPKLSSVKSELESRISLWRTAHAYDNDILFMELLHWRKLKLHDFSYSIFNICCVHDYKMEPNFIFFIFHFIFVFFLEAGQRPPFFVVFMIFLEQNFIHTL